MSSSCTCMCVLRTGVQLCTCVSRTSLARFRSVVVQPLSVWSSRLSAWCAWSRFVPRKAPWPGRAVAHGMAERVLRIVVQRPARRAAPGVSPAYKKPLYLSVSVVESTSINNKPRYRSMLLCGVHRRQVLVLCACVSLARIFLVSVSVRVKGALARVSLSIKQLQTLLGI